MPDTTGHTLHLGGLAIELVPDPRRSGVRVTVERDARVIATIPPDTDHDALTALLRPRLPWLYAKTNARRAEAAERPHRRFIDGEGFSYLGRNYRLKTVPEARYPVALVNGRLHLRHDRLPTASQDLVAWYTARARSWLPTRAATWADRMDLPTPDLTVRPLGHCWGSRSARGTLSIHWATMQLPTRLVDYVLVRELAHLRHPRPGRIIATVLPDHTHRGHALDQWGAGLWLPEAH
ncbi:M48 family metallopeptidase [Streptomyces sp. NPDC047821]|uniref:M48 family metallopeptidase n=1 Tax=Streptomyces sp. NPDC047821 TaxID=3365488 RepID=UPI00371932A1